MTEVIGIKFKKAGKVYYFDPSGINIEAGSKVVVETTAGVEIGDCAEGNFFVEDEKVVQPLRKALRIANDEDLKALAENKALEHEALAICQEKADAHGLDMKVVDVEYTFDRSKILFYFTADGRVDFRDLVKELAGVFKVRIELRQIGVRDEAKMLGGLGICGRPFCCSTYLGEFHPVSIKMAKEQNLSLNPTKISGTCGRLMCCLKYEQEAYTHLLKTMPRVASIVKTPEGEGTIVEVYLFKNSVKVLLSGKDEATTKIFSVDDITVIKSGRARAKKTDGNRDSDADE